MNNSPSVLLLISKSRAIFLMERRGFRTILFCNFAFRFLVRMVGGRPVLGPSCTLPVSLYHWIIRYNSTVYESPLNFLIFQISKNITIRIPDLNKPMIFNLSISIVKYLDWLLTRSICVIWHWLTYNRVSYGQLNIELIEANKKDEYSKSCTELMPHPVVRVDRKSY